MIASVRASLDSVIEVVQCSAFQAARMQQSLQRCVCRGAEETPAYIEIAATLQSLFESIAGAASTPVLAGAVRCQLKGRQQMLFPADELCDSLAILKPWERPSAANAAALMQAST